MCEKEKCSDGYGAAYHNQLATDTTSDPVANIKRELEMSITYLKMELERKEAKLALLNSHPVIASYLALN